MRLGICRLLSAALVGLALPTTPMHAQLVEEAQARRMPERPRHERRPQLGRIDYERNQIQGGATQASRLQATSRLARFREFLRASRHAGLIGRELGARDAGLTGPESGQWIFQGPTPGAGRVRALLFDPSNPSKLLAGTAGGGVWFSTDAGERFYKSRGLSELTVSALAVARRPGGSLMFYAGTGEGFGDYRCIVARGAGLFQSPDGVDWTPVPGTGTADFECVNALAVDASGAVLLAGTTRGLMRSVSVKRDDWEMVIPVPIAAIATHPTKPAEALAGGLFDGVVWRSVNGGQKWHRVAAAGDTGLRGRVSVAYATRNPSVAYAVGERCTRQDTAGTCSVVDAQVWRSLDGGANFGRRASLDRKTNRVALVFRYERYPADESAGFYHNALWAGDPLAADRIAIGGVDLWRSTDGGNTLERITLGQDAGRSHPDHHAIAAAPNYDGKKELRLYSGNDGGVSVTRNWLSLPGLHHDEPGLDPSQCPPKSSTAPWRELACSLELTQVYSIDGDRTTGTLVIGTQDNGTWVYRAKRWKKVATGDGTLAIVDRTDPRYIYASYQYLDLLRSDDGGESFQWLDRQGEDCPGRIDGTNAAFVAPAALDPGNGNVLYRGGTKLWRTNNARAPFTGGCSGPSWEAIWPATPGEDEAGRPVAFVALSISPADSNVLWACDSVGNVLRSGNARAARPGFSPVDAGSNGRGCTTIHQAGDGQTVLIAYSGYQRDNLRISRDGGTNWDDVSRNLPPALVLSVTTLPGKPDYVYAGTDIGLWASENAGASWSLKNEAPENYAVRSLAWRGRDLLVGTYGRGVFSIDLSQVR